jgi:hypothetical protein
MEPAAAPPPDADGNSATSGQTVGALAVTNVILILLVLGIGGGFIYVRFVYQPKPEPEMYQPYLAEARERLSEHADEITAEAQELAQELAPIVEQAVLRQLRKDSSIYIRVLERQGDQYLADAEQLMVQKLKAHYRDYLRAHREVIQEEFPEHASDANVEAVLNDFEDVFHQIVQRYYLGEFRTQTQRTIALWQEFEPAPLPGPRDPSLEEQLADYFGDWTILAVAESSQPGEIRNSKSEIRRER